MTSSVAAEIQRRLHELARYLEAWQEDREAREESEEVSAASRRRRRGVSGK